MFLCRSVSSFRAWMVSYHHIPKRPSRKDSTEWMDRCINKLMSRWIDEWIDGWINRWMNAWMSGWMSKWMNEWGQQFGKLDTTEAIRRPRPCIVFGLQGNFLIEINFCSSLEDSYEDQNMFALHHYNLEQIKLSPPPKDDTRKTCPLLMMNCVSLGLSSFFSFFIFHQHKRMFFSFLILPEIILVWMKRSDKFLSKGNRALLFLYIEDCLGKPAATTHHTLSTRNWKFETLWAWN